jgi:hypothetical protein
MSEAVADPTDDDPLFEPIGVGIKRDYSKRLPLYKSDITDGLNVQVRTKLCRCLACYVTQCHNATNSVGSMHLSVSLQLCFSFLLA